jgi:hypothetical protein
MSHHAPTRLDNFQWAALRFYNLNTEFGLWATDHGCFGGLESCCCCLMLLCRVEEPCLAARAEAAHTTARPAA